jgi:hypothetical protein
MVEQRENARELSKHLGVATIHRGPFVDDLCGFIQFSIFRMFYFIIEISREGKQVI